MVKITDAMLQDIRKDVAKDNKGVNVEIFSAYKPIYLLTA